MAKIFPSSSHHLPLHASKLHKLSAIINRSHTLIHSIASTSLLYHRLLSKNSIPFLPWLLVFASELSLFFIWLLNQAYGWRPLTRTVFPERLPADQLLPPIDVFICTADPIKEPPLKVMNTLLSAMSLDYPAEKLTLYLSDDGGSYGTLLAVRRAWGFAKAWLPFCKRYGVKIRCPEAYFAAASAMDDNKGCTSVHEDYIHFKEERDEISRKYEEFAEELRKIGQEYTSPDHRHNTLPFIQMINDDAKNGTIDTDYETMPRVVYVSREKKPDVPHHFKAGALNVLLRVSGVISNSPYILILDCDMYCNDPSSAREAMCFYLDPETSPSLAFVQFPQKFHDVSEDDIYDAGLRSIFITKWKGINGLNGPMMSGTCFYIKRLALYGAEKHEVVGFELVEVKQSFGPSNKLVKSLIESDYHYETTDKHLEQETELLASCTYESNTKWGQGIGFWYHCLLEDYFTGFMIHCAGWNSVFYDPSRPAFLGNATTNLNDTLTQGRRWNFGLFQVCLSRFNPLLYGVTRMPLLMSMCYGFFAFQPAYCVPVWIFATIPQLCLLNHIAIYPKVRSSWFMVYLFVFVSSLLKHLWETLETGFSTQSWWNEWRVWMIKSTTSYFYGCFDTFFTKASFNPTNKVAGSEQFERYQRGVFDFQASAMFLIPLVTSVILNMFALTGGVVLMISYGWEDIFGQVFLSSFILLVSKPVIEGMITRKDNGRIPPSVTLISLSCIVILISTTSIVPLL